MLQTLVLLVAALTGCDATPPPVPVPVPQPSHTDAPDAACDLHVDPAAREGGAGSLARPFRRLADAVAASAAGDVVCVAAGRLEDEGVTVPHPLELVGAGADESLLPFDLLVTATDASGAVRVRDLAVRTVSWSGGGPDDPAPIVVEDARLDEVVLSSPARHRYAVHRSEVLGAVVFSQAEGAAHHVLEDVVVGEGVWIVHGGGPGTNRLERVTIDGPLVLATGDGAVHEVIDSTFHGLADSSGACATLIRGNHLPTGSVEDTSGGGDDGVTEDHVYEDNVLDAGHLLVRSPSVTLRGNRVRVAEGEAGILVQTGSPTVVVDNVVEVAPEAVETVGIVLRSDKGEVRGNRVTGGAVGIVDRSGATAVTGNVVVGARVGIDAGGAGAYEDNTVEDCLEDGVLVRAYGPFRGNTVTGCGGAGVRVLAPADLGSTAGGNALRGNGGPSGFDLVVAVDVDAGALLARGNAWDHATVDEVLAADVWDGRDDPELASVVVDPLGR